MILTTIEHPTKSDAIGYDAVFLAPEDASSEVLHKLLEENFGARSGSQYHWTRYGDGRVVCRFPYAIEGSVPIAPVALGDRLMVRTRVNITKKTADGKRRAWPLHDKRPRRLWLDRRGLEHGFIVGAMAIVVEKDDIDHKGRKFWIDATTFTGWLDVVDAEKFNRLLAHGLPARRNWRFGLVEILEGQSQQLDQAR